MILTSNPYHFPSHNPQSFERIQSFSQGRIKRIYFIVNEGYVPNLHVITKIQVLNLRSIGI